MRALLLVALGCLVGCGAPVRVASFAAAPGGQFTYSAATNTVMTENDDGAAERIRRDWLTDTLGAYRVCPAGYVVDTRRFEQAHDGIFGNGGEIVYTGRCL
jgi:hypothetical protein